MDLTIRLAGEAGEGVVMAGEMLTLACARASFHVFTFRTYPAEIRGGPVMYQLRVSPELLMSHGGSADILLAMNWEGFSLNYEELKEGGVLLYDSKNSKEIESTVKDKGPLALYPLPLTDIAYKELNYPMGKNMVALGAMASIFRLPFQRLKDVMVEKFKGKGELILKKNSEALETGFQYAKEKIPKRGPYGLVEIPWKSDRLVLSGNEAIALGAIVAGCKFFAGYPITPATDIMEWMSREMPKFDGIVLQMEDEIAALAAVLGASFAGEKAMTATSGPGFSLMTELLGLASMAEIPVVIVDVQRAGPSTGLPTKAEQSDLNHAIYGGHGEFPRIVLSPTDVEDCFYQTINAFNLAEKCQLPVLLLTDQSLAHRIQTVPRFPLENIPIVNRLKPKDMKNYQRYRMTPEGISPISSPGGKEGLYTLTGLEHTPTGAPNYTPEMHQAMMAKRFRKLERIVSEIIPVKRYGPHEAELGIIGWGSTAGAVREAIAMAGEEGYKVAALYPILLNPVPEKEIQDFLSPLKKLLIPEINWTGQLATLLKSKLLIPSIQFNICGGLPFTPKQIFDKIKEVINNG